MNGDSKRGDVREWKIEHIEKIVGESEGEE